MIGYPDLDLNPERSSGVPKRQEGSHEHFDTLSEVIDSGIFRVRLHHQPSHGNQTEEKNREKTLLTLLTLSTMFAISCKLSPISRIEQSAQVDLRSLIRKYKKEKNHKELKKLFAQVARLRKAGKRIPASPVQPIKTEKQRNDEHMQRLPSGKQALLRQWVSTLKHTPKIRVGLESKRIAYLNRIAFVRKVSKTRELIETFFVNYPLWGTDARQQLDECEEHKLKGTLVLFCKRKLGGYRVKGNFFRFFIKKTGESMELQRIVANWRNLSTNQIPSFKMSQAQLDNIVKTKYAAHKVHSTNKVLVYDRRKKKLRPCWERILIGKSNKHVEKKLVIFDDTGETQLQNYHNSQTCTYTKSAKVHAFIPTNISTKKGTSECVLPFATVQERYDPSSCGCSCSGGYTTSTTDAQGNVSIPLNTTCTSGVQGCNAPYFRYTPTGPTATDLSGVWSGETFSSNDALGFLYDQNLCVGSNPHHRCICTDSQPLCNVNGVAYDAFYHINYMLSFSSSLGYSHTLGSLGYEIVSSSALGGVSCGVFSRVTKNIRLAYDRDCVGTPDLNATTYDDDWNYATTYHELMHAFAYNRNIDGGSYATLPNDTDARAAEEGRGNYIGNSMGHFTRGFAIVDQSSSRYRKYPRDFNCTAQCPTGVSCTSHYNGMIWENAFMHLEKLIGKKPSIDLVIGHSYFTDYKNAKFVRDEDLVTWGCVGIAPCSVTASGGSSWPPPPPNPISHYAAMLEANSAWYGGRYTNEIWEAFNHMLSINGCLRPPDDFGNHWGAPHLLAPGHQQTNNSVFVSSPPRFGSTIAIDYPGDRDLFHFYMPFEKTYRLSWDPLTAGLSLSLSVYKPDGTLLTLSSGTSTSLDITSPTAGWFAARIQASTSSTQTTGSYTLSLHNVSGDPEPDNINGEAIPILIDGTTYTATLNNTTDVDTFRFFTTAPAGTGGNGEQKYTIKMTMPTGLPIYIGVHESNGTLVHQQNSISPATTLQFDVNLPSGQWYYIRIHSPTQHMGTYTLSVEAELEKTELRSPNYILSDNTNTTLDAKDFWGAFELQATGPNSRIVAHMTDANDRFYRFFAEKHDQIILETSNLTGSADTIISIRPEAFHLFGPQGQVTTHKRPGIRGLLRTTFNSGYMQPHSNNNAILVKDDDGSIEYLASRVQLVAPRTGWYFAAVQPYSPYSTGSYQLNLTIRKGAAPILSLPTHQCQ